MNVIIPMVVAVTAFTPGQLPLAEKDLQTMVLTATVRVRQAGQGKEGSGVLIGKDGSDVYVLTAQHVIEGAKQPEVDIFTRDPYPKVKKAYRVAVVAQMRGKGQPDLALLRLTTDDAMPGFIRLCPGHKGPKGVNLPAMSAGCDEGKAPTALLDKTVTKVKASKPDDPTLFNFWQMDARCDPGNSGGPLIDKRGFLIGICSGTNRDKTYFTPHDEISNFFLKEHTRFRWLAEEKEKK